MSSRLSELPFLLPYSGLSRLLPSMSQRRGLWGDWEFPPSPACFGGVPLLWDPGAWEMGEPGQCPVTWLPSSRHEWFGDKWPGVKRDLGNTVENSFALGFWNTWLDEFPAFPPDSSHSIPIHLFHCYLCSRPCRLISPVILVLKVTQTAPANQI